MKIDAGSIASSQLQTELNARSSAAAANAVPSRVSTTDRTTFHSDAANVKSLVSQALATPDVRQAKVAQLRQAVNTGAYKVDTQKLATAMAADSAE